MARLGRDQTGISHESLPIFCMGISVLMFLTPLIPAEVLDLELPVAVKVWCNDTKDEIASRPP